MSEVLRAIISTYREVFKAPNLTDAVLFSNDAVAALVVDEVVREVRCAQPQRSAAQRNTAQERARAAASMACWQGMGLAGCALVARGLGERCSRQPPGLPKASGMRTASQLAAVPLRTRRSNLCRPSTVCSPAADQGAAVQGAEARERPGAAAGLDGGAAGGEQGGQGQGAGGGEPALCPTCHHVALLSAIDLTLAARPACLLGP